MASVCDMLLMTVFIFLLEMRLTRAVLRLSSRYKNMTFQMYFENNDIFKISWDLTNWFVYTSKFLTNP